MIFCHFKLDFKSQVGFKKLIQFFSLLGIDLLPCSLRRDCKSCSGLPSETQDQAWATVTSPCLYQVSLSFLCRELRQRYQVTFSLFFCLSPCTGQDGDHRLSSQKGETLGLRFSYCVPSHHLSSPLLSQAQQTASASAKDSSSLPTSSNGFSLHLQTTNIWACFCNSKCAIWQNKIHFPQVSQQGRGTKHDSLCHHGGNQGKGLLLQPGCQRYLPGFASFKKWALQNKTLRNSVKKTETQQPSKFSALHYITTLLLLCIFLQTLLFLE